MIDTALVTPAEIKTNDFSSQHRDGADIMLHTNNTHTSAFISSAFNIHDEHASGGDVKYCML